MVGGRVQFYEEAYRRVRRHSACVYIIYAARFQALEEEMMVRGSGKIGSG